MHRYIYPAVSPAPAEIGYSEQSLSQAPPGAAEVPYGHHIINRAVHRETMAQGPQGAYNRNGYIGNGYSEASYYGNAQGSVVSLNGNGSTTSYINGNGSVVSINGNVSANGYANGSTANGSSYGNGSVPNGSSYGNGSVANGSSYSPGDYQGHETSMQYVRRRLLPVLPTGGES